MATLIFAGIFNDAAFPVTHALVGAGNYILNTAFVQMTFLQSNAISQAVRMDFTCSTIFWTVLRASAVAAPAGNFQIPDIVIPNWSLILPRNNPISITINVDPGVTFLQSAVTLWGDNVI